MASNTLESKDKANPFSDRFATPPLETQNPNAVVTDAPPSYFNAPPPVDRRVSALAQGQEPNYFNRPPANRRVSALTPGTPQAVPDDPFSTPPIRIPEPPPDPRGPCVVSPPPRRSIEFDPARQPHLEFEPDRDYAYKPQPRVFGAGDPKVDKGINTDYDTNLKPEYNAYYNSVRPHPNPYDDVPTAEAAQRLSIANEENTRNDDPRPPLPLRPCPENHPSRKQSIVKKHKEQLKSRHEKIKEKLKGNNKENHSKEKMDNRDYEESGGRRTPRGGVWQKERRDWRTGEPIDDDSIYRHDLHDAGYRESRRRRAEHS